LKKRPRRTYSLLLFLPSSFHASLLPSSLPCIVHLLHAILLDVEDTTVNKNSESPPIPEVIPGEAVLVPRCFQTETDVAHGVASMTFCWDASLSIDRDTMVQVHIQAPKCFQQENKTEEIGQDQTSQTLKPGRAAGRINHLLAQTGHFRNGKEHFFSYSEGHIVVRPGLLLVLVILGPTS